MGKIRCPEMEGVQPIMIPVAITLNVSILMPSRAAVVGLDYRALTTDIDFKRAVVSIEEACMVNVHLGKVRC
jgi:hypothetical protein